MHHKRKGPKSTRAGCLLCKPYKRQGAPMKDRQRHGVRRQAASSECDDYRPTSPGEDPHRTVEMREH